MQKIANLGFTVPQYAKMKGVSIQYIHRLCNQKRLQFELHNGVRFLHDTPENVLYFLSK